MSRFLVATLLAIAALALLSTAGAQTLDPTYGGAGFARVDLQGTDIDLNDLVIDAKDRPTLALQRDTRTSFVARVTPTGQADDTFGTSGRVFVNGQIKGLFATDDDRIYAAGRSGSDVLLVRMAESGSEAPEDGGGRWRFSIGSDGEARAVTEARPGVLALAVRFRAGAGLRCGVLYVDEDGQRIASVGADGLVEVPGLPLCNPTAIVPYRNGVALVGDAETGEDERSVFVANLTRDGALRASFGDGGVALNGFADERSRAADAAVAPNGDLVVAGDLAKGPIVGVLLLRFQTNGAPASFGANGITWTPHPEQGVDFRGTTSLAIDGEGRFLVGSSVEAGRSVLPALVRFDARGFLDPTFSDDGILTYAAPFGRSAYTDGVAVDRFGRVHGAGTAQPESGSDAAYVLRLGGGTVVGTEAAAEARALRLAPNPTRGDAWVSLEAPGTVRLYDALGREAARTHGVGRIAVPTHGLAPGVYGVVVESEGERRTARLTLAR